MRRFIIYILALGIVFWATNEPPTRANVQLQAKSSESVPKAKVIKKAVTKLQPKKKPVRKVSKPKAVVTPVVVAPTPPTPKPLVYSGNHTDWMRQAGIAPGDWVYVDYIITRESTWNLTAYNPSGAYGLCQSLPAGKMITAGSDYMTNPITQLRWCAGYARDRYGSWAGAYLAWQRQHWW